MSPHATQAPSVPDGEPGSEHYDAFLSYSHHDREFALRLAGALAQRERVWVDESELPGGSRWSVELERAIEAADTFVFVLTPDSAASPECAEELAHAIHLGKRILPIHVRTTPLESLPEGLSAYQFIPSRGLFADDFDTSLAQLASAIATDRDWLREHTEWGEKASEWEKHDYDPSYLLAGAELEAAEQWRSSSAGKQPGLSALHNEFIDASRRSETRRLRRTRAFVSIALVAAIVFVAVALVLRADAVSAQHRAQSGAEAAESVLQLDTDPQLSLLLAVSAAHQSQTAAALDALRRAIPANYLVRTLQVDERPIDSAQWSPNGQTVLTAGEDGVARLWSATTGRVLRTFPMVDAPPMGALFGGGGREVITWDEDSVEVWSLGSPSAPPVKLDSPSGWFQLSDLAVSPDGGTIATASGPGASGSDSLWSARTGRRLHTLAPTSSRNWGGEVAFSPGGGLVAVGGENGTAAIYDVATGALQRVIDVARGDASLDNVSSVAFDPSGTRLLTGAGDGYTDDPNSPARSQIFSVATGRQLAAMNGDQPSFSQRGGFVATTSPDGTARVWEASNGQLVSQLKTTYPIFGEAQFAPDSYDATTRSYEITHVQTGSDAGFGAVWEAEAGTQLSSLAGDSGAVTAAGFSPSGHEVLTYSSDGAARIWGTGAVTASPIGEPARIARLLRSDNAFELDDGLGFAPGARPPLIAVSLGTHPPAGYGPGGSVLVMSARTGRTLATLPGQTTSVAFDPNGRELLALRSAGRGADYGPAPAQLRETDGGRIVRTLSGAGASADGAAFSPNGRLLATVDSDLRVAIWSVATGRRLVLFRDHVGRRSQYGQDQLTLNFSPDSRLIATSDNGGLTYVWNARTGRILNRIVGEAEPPGMQPPGWGGVISPDDKLVVTYAGWDDDGHVYRVGQGERKPSRQLLALLGGSGGINDATFDPDGTLIATISSDGVRLWDTREQSPVQTLSGSFGDLVEFTPGGKSLVTTNGPGSPLSLLACDVCGGFPRLLELARKRETRKLTAEERALYLGG